jgi:hypothetical protein
METTYQDAEYVRVVYGPNGAGYAPDETVEALALDYMAAVTALDLIEQYGRELATVPNETVQVIANALIKATARL